MQVLLLFWVGLAQDSYTVHLGVPRSNLRVGVEKEMELQTKTKTRATVTLY